MPSLSYTIGQLLGIIAFGIGIALFLLKDDRRFKSVMAGNSLLAALHLLLIGANSGALASTITSIRVFISKYKHFKWVGLGFIAIYAYSGYTQSVSIIDWAPSVACVLGTFGMYFLEGASMRVVIFVGTLLWLAYYITYFSIGGIIGECTILVVNLLTILRIRREKTLAKAPPFASD